MRHFWQRRLRPPNLLALVLSFAVAGCAGGPKLQEERLLRNQLEVIKATFLAGDTQRTIDYAKTYILKARGLERAEAMLFLGRALLAQKEYGEARSYFKQILIERPRKLPFRDQVEMGIADSFFLAGNFEVAARLYEEIPSAFPDSPAIPTAYYNLVLACQKVGRFTQAASYAQELRSRYPKSFEAERLSRGEVEVNPSWSVELGVYYDLSSAQALRDTLVGKGYRAYIHRSRSGSDTLFEVRLGGFRARTEAELVASELAAEGHPARVFP